MKREDSTRSVTHAVLKQFVFPARDIDKLVYPLQRRKFEKDEFIRAVLRPLFNNKEVEEKNFLEELVEMYPVAIQAGFMHKGVLD